MKGQGPPSSSSSAAKIEGHDDLLYDILILLPPKTLIKFKAVSPRWRSLISAPTFCRRHALHHNRRRDTQHSLLIQSKEGPNYLVSSCTNPSLFPRRFPFGDRSTVGVERSCNGLLLLRVETDSDLYPLRFYVFNSTTSEKRNLAPLPRDAGDIGALYLIFDPSLSPHYKVFCFMGRWEPIYIYSSETRRWKRTLHCIEKNIYMSDDDNDDDMSDDDDDYLDDISLRDGVYFNGGVYFLLRDYEYRSSTIFVGGDGRVSDVPCLPQCYYGENPHKDYAVGSNGVLLCVTLYWYYMGAKVCVQEMKEMESGWSKRYEHSLGPVSALSAFGGTDTVLSACGGVRCRRVDMIGVVDEDGDLCLLLRSYGRIVRYRFSDRVWDVVVSQEFVEKTKEWEHAHHFINTLALV